MSNDPTLYSVMQLARAYRTGELRPTEVVSAYQSKIETGPVYRRILDERASSQAERAERQFENGIDVGPLQGIPFALKDLFDIEGEVTVSGSPALARGTPATADAPAVARLDAAGAVFLGRTTMTELAFSGVGMNPHFGTPPNALDPSRIPGGSSSGSAVAVAAGLACVALGSDTGGSVRIPAAFNRIVGLKTTEGAIPTDGCMPLSITLDTIGPLAKSPSDAWIVYRALAALPPAEPPSLPPMLRFIAPTNVVREELDSEVEAAFDSAIDRLRAQGHEVIEQELPLLPEIEAAAARYGTLAAHEALALYEDLIDRYGPEMDPRVVGRIMAARGRSSSDYLRHQIARRRWQRDFWLELAGIDAVLAPTVPIVPPPLDELEDDGDYVEANRRCLRHTSLFNAVGGASISVPAGTGPIGVMVSAAPGNEGLVVAIGELLTAS